MRPLPSLRSASTALLLGAALAGAAPAEAQYAPSREAERVSGGRIRSEALARGRHLVVIDLDANRLYFARGRQVIWSAPVGTGTGFRLEGDDGEWEFSTPQGVFHVQYKERDPVWIAPDWYFVENGLPVPPRGDARRRFPGGLGEAALYLGHGLAIHGTDKPELLGQRVSHGCIRLANRDALRLFHSVVPGTEVVIVGDPPAPPAEASPAPGARRRARDDRPRPRDPLLVELERERTRDLLDRLDEELWVAGDQRGQSAWPTVAGELSWRATSRGDDGALEGLLARAGTQDGRAERDEYAAVLAATYAHGTLRTLEALGGLQRRERERAAAAIVQGTARLYPGDLSATMAPWPTRRAPREAAGRAGERGWDALRQAEQEMRAR